MKNAKSLLTATLLLLVIVVVLQNTEAVETKLLFFTVSMPRALLLMITLGVGVVAGLIFGTRLRGSSSKKDT